MKRRLLNVEKKPAIEIKFGQREEPEKEDSSLMDGNSEKDYSSGSEEVSMHKSALEKVKEALIQGGKAEDVVRLIDDFLSGKGSYEQEESMEEEIIKKLASKV